MSRYKIALLPGDGVGRDVMDAARLVLDRIGLDADYREGDIGWDCWVREGNPLPDRTIELLRSSDCCLFGAITSKPKEDAARELNPELQGRGYAYSSPIVRLRQLFDLHVNLRPCRAYPGNPLNFRDDIDLVIFRQNTEGSYAGVEFHPLPGPVGRALAEHHPKMVPFAALDPEEVAVSLRIVTRAASRRIIEAAFSYAESHGYRKVTLAEKANVLRETGGLILEQARAVAAEHPGVELEEANIDALCMWLVRKPQEFGVIAAENLFGDIISDLAGGLVGGLGFASSANIGDDFAVFEPTHGSAPKYAGMHKVNPTAMILSVKLMLDYLGESEWVRRLDAAVAGVIAGGKVRTYDMGGGASTMDMAAAVAERL